MELALANAAANRALALLFMATGRADKAETALAHRLRGAGRRSVRARRPLHSERPCRQSRVSSWIRLAAQPGTDRGALRSAGRHPVFHRPPRRRLSKPRPAARPGPAEHGRVVAAAASQLLMADRKPDEALKAFQLAEAGESIAACPCARGRRVSRQARRSRTRKRRSTPPSPAIDPDVSATLGLARLRLDQDRVDEAIGLGDRAREEWPAPTSAPGRS